MIMAPVPVPRDDEKDESTPLLQNSPSSSSVDVSPMIITSHDHGNRDGDGDNNGDNNNNADANDDDEGEEIAALRRPHTYPPRRVVVVEQTPPRSLSRQPNHHHQNQNNRRRNRGVNNNHAVSSFAMSIKSLRRRFEANQRRKSLFLIAVGVITTGVTIWLTIVMLRSFLEKVTALVLHIKKNHTMHKKTSPPSQ